MPSLNIIGAGQVGKPLGRLLAEKLGFTVNCILNTSVESAQSACEFIGQGTPITSFDQLIPADIYLITTPDEQIEATATRLANAGKVLKNNLIFHCSGVVSSSKISMLKSTKACIASLHPIKSFVDPKRSYNTFKGTPCALEGDKEACKKMEGWIEKIGGKACNIQEDKKEIYHSALVLACNNLVSLTEASLQTLAKAGIAREEGMSLLKPIMEGSLAQIQEKGTVKALSGPIARGEAGIVKAEIDALQAWNPQIATLYKELGKVALALSKQKGVATDESLVQIQEIL